MAKDIKINIGGVEYEIQGDDLASESTLNDLLEAIKGTSNRAARDRSSETQSAKRHAEALDEATEGLDGYSATLLRAQRDAQSSSGGMLSKLKGGLFAGLGMLWGGVKAVLGVVSAAFLATLGSVVEITGMLKEMYASGVRLPVTLAELSYEAGMAGMTIGEYSKFIVKNQMILTKFGDGSVVNGTRKLTDMARTMVFATGGLSRLGLTIGEVSEYLIDYSKIQTAITQSDVFANLNDAATQDRLRKETTDYISELDKLARTTGQTREQMNDLIKQAAVDPDLQATMAALGLSEEQRKNITKFAATMSTMPGGDTLKAAMGQILQFGTATGETGAALALISPSFGKTMHDITNSLRNGTISNLDAQKLMTQALDANAGSIAESLGKIPEEQRTQAQRNLLLAALESKERKRNIEAMAKQAGMTTDAYEAEQDKIMTAKGKFDDAMNLLKSTYNTVMLKIFASPAVIKVVAFLTSKLQSFSEALLKATGPNGDLSNLGKLIVDFIKESFQAIQTQIWPAIKPIFDTLYNKIFIPLYDSLAKLFDEVIEKLMRSLDLFISKKFGGIPGVEDYADAVARYAALDAGKDTESEKAKQGIEQLNKSYNAVIQNLQTQLAQKQITPKVFEAEVIKLDESRRKTLADLEKKILPEPLNTPRGSESASASTPGITSAPSPAAAAAPAPAATPTTPAVPAPTPPVTTDSTLDDNAAATATAALAADESKKQAANRAEQARIEEATRMAENNTTLSDIYGLLSRVAVKMNA